MAPGVALSADTAPGRESQLPATRATGLRPQHALALPFAFTLGLLALSFLPGVRANPRLFLSFWGAGAALLAWNVVLLGLANRGRRVLALAVLSRTPHSMHAC